MDGARCARRWHRADLGVTEMTFEVETDARLIFPDGKYEGAEVFARISLSIGEYFDVLAVRNAEIEEPRRYAEDMMRTFAPYLVSWNLTKNGEPVPCDFDGLWSIDRELAKQMCIAWQRAVEGLPGPLGQPSSGGRPSAELSMPMEPLSESQAS